MFIKHNALSHADFLGRVSIRLRILALIMLVIISLDQVALGASPWSEFDKITASDGTINDGFGRVSIDGDNIIIGASGTDDYGSDSGSAYIYSRNHGGADMWGEVKKIYSSFISTGDWFGASVAISGDYAIVGAMRDTLGYTWSGAAYIFSKNHGGVDNWGQVKVLRASSPASYDAFGNSVALDGDYAVVGAPMKNSQNGAVYVLSKNLGGTDNWGHAAQIYPSVSGKMFGADVDFDGNYIIIGTLYENAVYIHYRSSGNLAKRIPTPRTDGHSSFNKVSISGDYAVVGDQGDFMSSGIAYIFHRNEGGVDNWGLVKELLPSVSAIDDHFGRSVKIEGDYIFVGSGNNSSCGGSYVFYRNEGGTDNWGQQQELDPSSCDSRDFFGSHIGVSGRYAVIGATGDDDNGSDAGAAYIWRLPAEPTLPDNMSVVSSGLDFALLTWSDNSDDETGFKVERKAGANATWIEIRSIGEDVVGYKDEGLSANTTYTYRVRAYNDLGFSDYSNEIQVTTFELIAQ